MIGQAILIQGDRIRRRPLNYPAIRNFHSGAHQSLIAAKAPKTRCRAAITAEFDRKINWLGRKHAKPNREFKSH
jgi:hypothetical protein